MQFDEVVTGRRSIRGYKSDPVPKALIEEVLALAMRSPSSMNTQPWNFTVLSGEPLDLIRAGNTERNLAGVPHSREFRIGQAFAGQHRDRQVGVAKQLFAAMDIARDDKKNVKIGYYAVFVSLMPLCALSSHTTRCSRTATIPHLTAGCYYCIGQRCLVSRPWRGDQQPRHHAVARGTRARKDRRRSSHYEGRCTGLAR